VPRTQILEIELEDDDHDECRSCSRTSRFVSV